MSEAYFVVVSGIPASGKTTLARALSAKLQLPVIDKDDDLEALFRKKGTGDAAWRRKLSRESDDLFMRRALNSPPAILSSFWHHDGMPPDSGTPTDWLFQLPAPFVHVRCNCHHELAARRFLQRTRHPGHLDGAASASLLVYEFEALAVLPPLDLGPRVDVDTSVELDLSRILTAIRSVI